MSGPESHHLRVDRTARVVTIGGPGKGAGSAKTAWVVCHGYRQLASRFIRRFEGIADASTIVVAPEGLSRFYADPSPGRHGPDSRVGATWMTREDREAEIADYVAYLDRVAEVFTAGVGGRVALGFSQGVHTVVRWVALGNSEVDRVVLWGAYVPEDLDLVQHRERLAAVQLIQVQGDRDSSRSSELERAQDERLLRAGLRLRKLSHPGGHEIDPALLDALVIP